MTLTLSTLRATIAATLPLVVAAWAPAPAAGASRGQCVVGERGGPTCLVWSGRAVGAPDGDTANVAIEGAAPRHVRITGIQAMEGRECHGASTTARLNRLIRAAGGRVRLAARSAGSYSQGRPRRSVAGRIGGRWVDFGRVLISEGYVLWDSNPVEDAWNVGYSRLVQRAALLGRRLWNPRACGDGPGKRARLRVLVRWDADGDDQVNRNGEYIRISNRGGAGPVSLRGWWVRDAALRRYVFGRSARIPVGRSLTLHIGSGRDTGSSFYWGRPRSIFENFDHPDSASAVGDGAYLFDPRGNLRASMIYPCRYACANPLRARISMTVDYIRSDEAVLIHNVSASPVDLDGQLIEMSNSRTFDFGARSVSSVVGPGETMRVEVGGDPSGDSRLSRHMGLAPPILQDGGGWVELRTFTHLLTACYEWGNGDCAGSA